jgi:hypothetical protein
MKFEIQNHQKSMCLHLQKELLKREGNEVFLMKPNQEMDWLPRVVGGDVTSVEVFFDPKGELPLQEHQHKDRIKEQQESHLQMGSLEHCLKRSAHNESIEMHQTLFLFGQYFHLRSGKRVTKEKENNDDLSWLTMSQ